MPEAPKMDESEVRRAAGDVIDLYTRHADAWDAARGAEVRIEGAWLSRLADGLPPGGRVLDLGCGTGQPLGAWLLDRGFAVTGVDASAPAVERARRRLPWDSLFHLTHDDQRALFPVFGAHAAPGTRLMFTSGPEAGTAMGVFGGDPLHHASLSPAEYRDLLARQDFEVLQFTPEDPDCGGHSVWLARRRLG